MASDEKRREVAENLRYLTIRPYIHYKEQFFDELAEVVLGFEDFHDFNTVLEKLADLIDRPTCEMESRPGARYSRSRGDAAQEIGEVIGALRYHERHMTSVPPKIASHLAEHLERAVGEL